VSSRKKQVSGLKKWVSGVRPAAGLRGGQFDKKGKSMNLGIRFHEDSFKVSNHCFYFLTPKTDSIPNPEIPKPATNDQRGNPLV